MPNVRRVVFNISVETDTGTVRKQGNTAEQLEDALWALYDADLLPFTATEEDDGDDGDDDDELIDLDDEIEELDPPRESPAPLTPEE